MLLRGVRRAAEDTSSCRKAGGHPSEFSSPDPESGTSQRLASVLSVAWTGAQLGSALVSACGGPMPMAELSQWEAPRFPSIDQVLFTYRT